MIIVADTSVLLNLAFLELDDLLADLFHEVWVPSAVAAEFERMSASSGRFGGLKMPSACHIRQVLNIPAAFTTNSKLDAGEIEALTLALQEQADAILLDEFNAREIASQLSITAIGTLGLLLIAKQHGLITEIAPLLRRLIVEGHFRLSGDLVREALRKAGELP